MDLVDIEEHGNVVVGALPACSSPPFLLQGIKWVVAVQERWGAFHTCTNRFSICCELMG